MPMITQSINKDYLDMYDGYDQQEVGLGVVQPNIYATPAYKKKKIKSLILGGISEIQYAGMEHDRNPLILTMAYEGPYSTVIGYNLHYCPPKLRSAILKFVLDSNVARIKANQPIIVDYHALKRAIPDSQYLVRRYKVVGINVLETYRLSDWPEAVKDRSKWEGHYKMIKEGKVR
jgi:hypothetical protein